MAGVRRTPGEVGRRLLEQVVEEDFVTFLSSLRAAAYSIPAPPPQLQLPFNYDEPEPPPEHLDSHQPLPPYYPFLRIPSLDTIIHSLYQHHYHTHQQKHQQYIAQHYEYLDSEPPSPPPPPFPPPFIELLSTSPCAGKTHILYHLCATTLFSHPSPLPSSQSQGDFIPRQNRIIVIIDCDHRFNTFRLTQILQSHLLRHHNPPSPATDLTTSFLTALQNIHIFRPTSSAELLTILTGLENYLLSLPQSNPISSALSTSPILGGIIIDGITSWYWRDRVGTSVWKCFFHLPSQEDSQYEEVVPDDDLEEAKKSPMERLSGIYGGVVAALQKVQERLGGWIVVTRRGEVDVPGGDDGETFSGGSGGRRHHPSRPQGTPQYHHQHQPPQQGIIRNAMPQAYNSAITLRLHLSREHHQPHPVLPNTTATFVAKVDAVGSKWGGTAAERLVDMGPRSVRYWIDGEEVRVE